MSYNTIQAHLQKLARAHAQITNGQDGFVFSDFFDEPLGQGFGVDIDWLAQFSIINTVYSCLKPSVIMKNWIQWYSSPEVSSIIKKQKLSIRDRLRFWLIKWAIKPISDPKHVDEPLEEEDDAAFEILAEQKTRYLAIFVLSGYAYAESYTTSLVNQALTIEHVAEYACKTIKIVKKEFNIPPSKLDPTFSQFQKLVNHKKRNALEKLDLIVQGMLLHKEIVSLEKSLKIPSTRGSFVHFLNIRNQLAHAEPLKDLEEYSLSQLDAITTQMQAQWEVKKQKMITNTPEIKKPLDWIDDLITDYSTSMIGIQILGLMLIGYPSLVEKLITCELG